MCNELACNIVSRLCLVIRGRCVSPCDGVGSLSGKLSSRSRSLLSALSGTLLFACGVIRVSARGEPVPEIRKIETSRDPAP